MSKELMISCSSKKNIKGWGGSTCECKLYDQVNVSTCEHGHETQQESVHMSKWVCRRHVSEYRDASVYIHTGECTHAGERVHRIFFRRYKSGGFKPEFMAFHFCAPQRYLRRGGSRPSTPPV